MSDVQANTEPAGTAIDAMANRMKLKRGDGGFTTSEKACLMCAVFLFNSDRQLARILLRMTSISNYDSML